MLPDFKFHHIGIITKSIDSTSSYYINAGYEIKLQKVFDPIQDVWICFLKKFGEPLVELIEPSLNSTKFAEQLKKNGVSPYHVCYEVNDINGSIKKLKAQKYIQISQPLKAVAIENRLICFLFNKDIGLIELVQSS